VAVFTLLFAFSKAEKEILKQFIINLKQKTKFL
jgi:hypothetical protein